MTRALSLTCVVLLAAPALAAPVASPPIAVPRRAEPYWFKTYSTAPYKETWTGELALKDFAKGRPKALAAIDKAGGKLTAPLGNFAASAKEETQQVSFTIALKPGRALIKELRRLGDLPDPAVRASGAPIPVAEVEAKIDALMKDKTERAAELARVPATAAAAEEILEHLLFVEELSRRADGEALVNLTMRQR